MACVIMMSIFYAEHRNKVHNAESHYAECHYTGCHYAKCRGPVFEYRALYGVVNMFEFVVLMTV
jgi:hypothetical protein